MRRLPWWAVTGSMLMLAGCFFPDEDAFHAERERTCGTSFVCPEGSSCKSGSCELDFLEVDPASCGTGCAPYQVCARLLAEPPECVDRYSELKLESPSNGGMVDGGTLAVRARLVSRPEVTAEYPERLDYRVVRSDGGTAAVGTVEATGAESGSYSAEWTLPAQDGVFELTAAYPKEGGPSAAVWVTLDNTPPALTVVIPPAAPRQDADGFTHTDPGAASSSWRRDQTVRMEVKSDSADVDPSSLSVVVRGFTGGADVTDLSLAPATPCDTVSCWSVDVPLWRPGLPAFRGGFSVEVTAKDHLGNQGQASGYIPVTRWKWAFEGGAGPIRSTPAIGQQGTIYFGTTTNNGKVFALGPEGTMKWERQLGDVLGSPAVGAYSSGAEMLYVGANKAGIGALYTLDSEGNEVSKCPSSGPGGEIVASIAITHTQLDSESGPVETAIAFRNADGLVSSRPTAESSTAQCIRDPASGYSSEGSSVIARGANVYYSRTTGDVRSYQFMGAGWVSKPGYLAPDVNNTITGMAFLGEDRIVGAAGQTGAGKDGSVFSFLEADGAILWEYPRSSMNYPPIRNMSVGEGNVLFFGHEDSSGTAELMALDHGADAPRVTVPNAGSFTGAPVLGTGGTLYTASFTGASASIGEVSAWNAADLSNLWRLSDNVGRAEASPTLDCARDSTGYARPDAVGVLYVPSVDGKLYSFIVDSRGLDASAPWPKYQHDARNTGNPATPVSSCP